MQVVVELVEQESSVELLLVAGTVNTGGGGGMVQANGAGGAGGSGIVIVKVPAAYTVAASPTPARALSTHPDGEQ